MQKKLIKTRNSQTQHFVWRIFFDSKAQLGCVVDKMTWNKCWATRNCATSG